MNMGQLVEQGSGEVYALGFEPVGIGRHGDNEIILADPQVSRHHAEIVMQGGRWVVSDLGSANGTFVNGQLALGPQVINHGDLIRVGQTQFQVEIAGAMATQDTLVEAVPTAAAPVAAVAGAAAAEPVPRPQVPRLVTVLASAAVVIIVVTLLLVFVVRPLMQGDSAATPAASATTVAAAAASVEPVASPTPTTKPTETAIPTIPPPTTLPTVIPPTEAPPAETDTPTPKPVIGYFRTSQNTIEQGKCTRLEWGEVENANRITLTDVGPVGSTGKVDVCLDSTKTYTLQAIGAGGTTAKNAQITVEAPTGPVIEYLRVVPSIIAPSGCAQLEWGPVQNAESASIEPGIGGVGTPDSIEVCPSTTTTYVLTARNADGSSTAETTLHVSTGTDSNPVISFFTANPANIEAGECTTLSWGKVDYATSVTIDNNIGGVATPGSQEVCLGTETTFVMTAEGPGGTTETSLVVNVSPGALANLPDLVIESILFEPNPCYRGLKCRVRIKVRNDGPLAAGHFVVRWAPEGEGQVPVDWDVDSLGASEEKDLVYPWIPNRVDENWRTLATADLNKEVNEISEGVANSLGQIITVLEP
jgi:pSer/pThr/pTyr-binding forkhead associated (FHA) protein